LTSTTAKTDITMPTTKQHLGILGLVASLSLTGCAGLVIQEPLRLDPSATTVQQLAPSKTAVIQQELSIERWWLVFNDAALERLMEEALKRNEDLESAVARIREAQASLDIAGAARAPTLDAQGSAKRQQDTLVGARPLPPGVDRRASSHQLSLTAGYELDLWGRISALNAAARHQLLAAAWARAAVEWGLTARLAEAYFGLAAVDRQIALSEAVRASRETTLKLRQRERAAGAGTELDVRRAEAELAGTDATLASLTRQRISLERALTALLGRTPAEIAAGALPRAALDESKPFTPVLPQGAAADLLVRRPDVRQAEEQLAAANASIDAARAATLPSVRLSGALGTDARSVGNLFSAPSIIFSLAANAAYAIADGGKAKARVQEEHARAEQALANYRKVIASAVLDVRETYATLDINQQSLFAQRERVTALARARELARRGFDNGALNYLDVLDAERNWYQAQLDQVSAYKDQLTGQVAAFKALGGGYVPLDIQANAN
jgi:multidrug efflux system outer membrane protein